MMKYFALAGLATVAQSMDIPYVPVEVPPSALLQKYEKVEFKISAGAREDTCYEEPGFENIDFHFECNLMIPDIACVTTPCEPQEGTCFCNRVEVDPLPELNLTEILEKDGQVDFPINGEREDTCYEEIDGDFKFECSLDIQLLKCAVGQECPPPLSVCTCFLVPETITETLRNNGSVDFPITGTRKDTCDEYLEDADFGYECDVLVPEIMCIDAPCEPVNSACLCHVILETNTQVLERVGKVKFPIDADAREDTCYEKIDIDVDFKYKCKIVNSEISCMAIDGICPPAVNECYCIRELDALSVTDQIRQNGRVDFNIKGNREDTCYEEFEEDLDFNVDCHVITPEIMCIAPPCEIPESKCECAIVEIEPPVIEPVRDLSHELVTTGNVEFSVGIDESCYDHIFVAVAMRKKRSSEAIDYDAVDPSAGLPYICLQAMPIPVLCLPDVKCPAPQASCHCVMKEEEPKIDEVTPPIGIIDHPSVPIHYQDKKSNRCEKWINKGICKFIQKCHTNPSKPVVNNCERSCLTVLAENYDIIDKECDQLSYTYDNHHLTGQICHNSRKKSQCFDVDFTPQIMY
jgi:hypothetical protein